jgi:hypothetical protein
MLDIHLVLLIKIHLSLFHPSASLRSTGVSFKLAVPSVGHVIFWELNSCTGSILWDDRIVDTFSFILSCGRDSLSLVDYNRSRICDNRTDWTSVSDPVKSRVSSFICLSRRSIWVELVPPSTRLHSSVMARASISRFELISMHFICLDY